MILAYSADMGTNFDYDFIVDYNKNYKFSYYKVVLIVDLYQKYSPRCVPKKRCSENMQQIYRRTPMPKYSFNKVALQLC